MSSFGADPRAFFDSVYREAPPWGLRVLPPLRGRRAGPLRRRPAQALLPGGRYYLLAFAVEFPPPSPGQVTEDGLRARFTADGGWRIREIRSAEFLSRFAPVPATGACIERLPAPLA
jgi:hypothetical protein